MCVIERVNYDQNSCCKVASISHDFIVEEDLEERF